MLEEQPIFNNQTLDASSNQPFSNSLEPFQTDSTEFSSDQMMHSPGEMLIDIGENQGDYTAENISDIGNIFDPVISSTKNALTELANHSNIDEILGTSFGVNYNQDIANDLINNFAKKDFLQSPNIKLVSGQVFNGAYAQENNTIYISQEFVAENLGNISTIQGVLLEEFGHYLDSQINVEDSMGDEGDIFQRLVQGISITEIELVSLKNENDFASLVIDGKELLIEQNTFTTFQAAISSSPRDGGFTKERGGWTNNNDFPRMSADVDGDGKADIVGFGGNAVYVSLSNGDGTFQTATASSPGLTKSSGWTNNNDFPRMLADVNGDGKADIVGFGEIDVYVSLSNGNGTFQTATASSPGLGFTKSWSWANNNDFPRMLADVNGDGKADIVGFHETHVYVSLSNGNGTFQTATASSPGFTKSWSWANNNDFPRMLADVNGDGKADIVGFHETQVYISLGNGNGTFQTATASSPGFTKKNGGWNNNDDFPRMLADVNGDGKADIVGFGERQVFTSLGNGNGTFQAATASSPAEGGFTKKNGGWNNNNDFPRMLADVNGDGKDDILGFGGTHVFTSFASVAPQGMTLPDNFLNLSNGEQQNYLGINPYSTSYSAQGNKFVSSNGTGATYLWCTDYAYGRAIEKSLFQNNSGIGARISGHAGVWDNQTSQYNTVVRQNSIVVWDPLKGGAGGVGHVAFVEEVYADGSFLISESNWDSARMSFNVRHIKPGTKAFKSAKFIYL